MTPPIDAHTPTNPFGIIQAPKNRLFPAHFYRAGYAGGRDCALCNRPLLDGVHRFVTPTMTKATS